MKEQIGDVLAAVNATLNGTSAALICLGWVMIKQGKRETHRRLMIAAFATSTLFLTCYLTRVALTGTHLYPGHGVLKTVYYTILFSHMTLAAITPFLVVGSLYLGLKSRFVDHKRLVRWALPIWLYVSVTGVLVYLMLYHGPH